MSSSGDDIFALLGERLEAHGINPTFVGFSPQEWESLQTGAGIPRLAELDTVAEEVLEQADRFIVPERAAHLDEQARILDSWRSAFDGLDALRLLTAAVARFSESRLESEPTAADSVGEEVLRRLFWSGQLIASEVVTLMRNGYPAGALARWRALYEVSVRASVINRDREQLGPRFMDHEQMRQITEVRRWDRDVARNHKRDDEEAAALAALDEHERSVIEHYGPLFPTEYGWAHDHLKDSYASCTKKEAKGERPKGPTLPDLVRSLAIDKPRLAERENYYARASAAVHGSPRSLGTFDDRGGLRIWSAPASRYLGLAGDQTCEDLAGLTDAFANRDRDPATEPEFSLYLFCVLRLSIICQNRFYAASQQQV